jgi:hypothetical protein
MKLAGNSRMSVENTLERNGDDFLDRRSDAIACGAFISA